ncbi:MAG: aminotransferase class I/II-fold pyridoxal phosphate-dependent enzyme, partial [Pseudomonadota bacterium]
MQFPERFSDLPEYAFPRLRALLDGVAPGGREIAMSLGEPTHPFPDFVAETIAAHAGSFNRYPPNEGMPELREAIAAWVALRYGVSLDPAREVFPLNGTREGLFNACLALSPETKGGARPAVLLPNPFYQCYAAAALAVGAEPVYVPATAETGFLPDFAALPEEILARATIAYMCSPSNPQGAVADTAWWQGL